MTMVDGSHLRPMTLPLTALYTALWCLGHSLPITPAVRRRLTARWPQRYPAVERLLYVLFSTATLIWLMAWWRQQPAVTLWAWSGPWAALRGAALLASATLFVLGARSYNGAAFLGLTQLRAARRNQPPQPPVFTTTGILGAIRHPWYTAMLLGLVFGLPVTDVNLVWRLVFMAYILVGTELEERKLLAELGAPYATYRQTVPRYFPIPRRAKPS